MTTLPFFLFSFFLRSLFLFSFSSLSWRRWSGSGLAAAEARDAAAKEGRARALRATAGARWWLARGPGRRCLALFSAKRRALGAPSADAAPTAARSPSAARSIGVHFGSMDSYGRIKKISEGAFGVVSKARHLDTGELVAIKTVLEGGEDEELLREAGLLALCGGNPAVVELREVVRCPETSKLCLVMEFVGPSLLDILRRRRRRRLGRAFSESDTRHVMRQLLGGVEAMHAQGVVHWDLKPGNVLVGERDGWVRICDLGLGKAMAKAPPHTQSVETLWYMAPGASTLVLAMAKAEGGKEEVRSIWMKKGGRERAGEGDWRKKEKRKREERRG